MRLIDADEFEKRISEYNTTDITDSILYNFAHSKLISMPTIQGRTPAVWLNNQNGTFECSRCGCKHSRSRFCPDCGSFMKEEISDRNMKMWEDIFKAERENNK